MSLDSPDDLNKKPGEKSRESPTGPTENDSDQELVRMARSMPEQGDRSTAQHLLLKRHFASLDGQIHATSRRSPAGVDSEEFSQMIWEKVLAGWPEMISKYTGPQPLRNYLSVCVAHKALDLARVCRRDPLSHAEELEAADERGDLNGPNLFLIRSGTRTPQEVLEDRDRNEKIMAILQRIANGKNKKGPVWVLVLKLRYMIPGEAITKMVQPMIVKRAKNEEAIVGRDGLFDGKGRLRLGIIADLLSLNERTVMRYIDMGNVEARKILQEYGVEGFDGL